MGNKTLFQLSADMAAIEDALIENGGELTEEIELMLTETEKGLQDKVDGYAAIIHKLSYSEDVLDAEIKRLQARKKVFGNAKERLKNHVSDTMGVFGMTKIESNYNTFTRRKSTRLDVDEDAILAPYLIAHEEYRKTLPPYITAPDLKVSKTAIKDMQKVDGILPSGASFVESYSLIIR